MRGHDKLTPMGVAIAIDTFQVVFSDRLGSPKSCSFQVDEALRVSLGITGQAANFWPVGREQ